MTSEDILRLIAGIIVGAGTIPLLYACVTALAIQVEDEEAVLITRFGKLIQTLSRPGWHWYPARLLPWVKAVPVSLRKDFRELNNIHINDARGTTVIVDLWLELKISDPDKAMFHVADWDRSLQNLVAHSAISILGNRDFQQILCDRTQLGALLQKDVSAETSRWGVQVDLVLIRNVSLLPEVADQVLDTVSARLESAKAAIEEEGRQRVALLDAQTDAQIAELVTEAKGQYPAAVGRAMEKLGKEPAVLAAYNELYELSLIRPHRTVAFSGFKVDEMKAVDAAMLGAFPAPTPPVHNEVNGMHPENHDPVKVGN